MTTDLAKLPVKPLPFEAIALPVVSAYQGTYPLQTLSVVGRTRDTDTRNTILFICWQRSLVPPGPVKDLSAKIEKGGVTLNWSANAYAALATAAQPTIVKRAIQSGGPYKEIARMATQPGLTYTDMTAQVGTSYYYVVTGANPAGEGSRSNEVAVMASGAIKNDNLPPGETQAHWLSLTPPAAGRVTVHVPKGYGFGNAWNLTTRAPLVGTFNGEDPSYGVLDDPMCVEVTAVAK